LAWADGNDRDKRKQGALNDIWFHGISSGYCKWMPLSAARLSFLPGSGLKHGGGKTAASHRMQDAKRDPLK
jgi:hypothetical protein